MLKKEKKERLSLSVVFIPFLFHPDSIVPWCLALPSNEVGKLEWFKVRPKTDGFWMNISIRAWTKWHDISKFDIWVTWVGFQSKTSKTDFCNKFQSEFEQHHIQVFLLMVFTCPNPNPTLLERYIVYWATPIHTHTDICIPVLSPFRSSLLCWRDNCEHQDLFRNLCGDSETETWDLRPSLKKSPSIRVHQSSVHHCQCLSGEWVLDLNPDMYVTCMYSILF